VQEIYDFKEQYGGLIQHNEMEETIEKEIEEVILEDEKEIFKKKEKVNVTEFKIEENPPVIKPTKELTKKREKNKNI